jgi:type III restriction enzyme
MTGKKIFNTQDLVLKVSSKHYDPLKYPIDDWDRFLDILCSNRSYQKEVIKTALYYLASDTYKTIEDLIRENYRQNEQLQERYRTEAEYFSKVQFPQKRSASIDLATGTGKSYVMYGIAQIALGLGLVNKVLLLGPPSLTIEKELTNKFSALSANVKLKNAIPQSSKCQNPSIINAGQTIKDYCVCIENINAVYSKTGSSIFDSLCFGKGGQCLVLNDEVHHAYNKVEGNTNDSRNIKRWKEFLLDTSYGFTYILGFTGTSYIENDYFNDVIYRFSLRSAIENNFVKKVSYVVENTDTNENEKFQKILQNHKRNKDTYSEIKPITILITKDIKEAKKLKTRLVEFLVSKKEGTEEALNGGKVLVVTSDKDHKANVLRLSGVDSKEEAAEWIISVAMLTEGWDVKNVFQIVPMEEKAFNSKLLIAQVLGRGLRIPAEYPNSPEVTVFNHDKWSPRIRDLVEEILEMETRIKNSPLAEGIRAKHHFAVYKMNYTTEKREIKNSKPEVFNYKDHIRLASESFVAEPQTRYLSVGGKDYTIKYTVEKEKKHISEIVNTIYKDFQDRKLEGKILNLDKEEYTNENLPSKDAIESYIKFSMEKVGLTGDYLGPKNTQAVYTAFATLLRKKNLSVKLVNTFEKLDKIYTKDKEHESISVLGLRSGAAVFCSDDYENEIVLDDSKSAFEEIRQTPLGDSRFTFPDPVHVNLFKTPVDIVFANRNPERTFILGLTESKNAACIDSWFKSKNQAFYSIEYSFTKGTHTNTYQFNPDFFILMRKPGVEIEYISVVEIKSDDDDNEENRQKYFYAKRYFEELNQRITDENIPQKYFFNFLSPSIFADYFAYLQDGRLIDGQYKSELDNMLEEGLEE